LFIDQNLTGVNSLEILIDGVATDDLPGLARVASFEEAMVLALRQCRIPCLNAAVTTAIGLLTLWMIPVAAIRSFGLFCAAGVLLSYVLTMTLAPLLLLWLPTRPAASLRRNRVEHFLQAIAAGVFRHPAILALAWFALLVAALAGISRLQVETDMIRALRPGSPLREATLFIDQNLTGVNSLEILIDGVATDDLPGLARVASFEEAMLPGLRKVTGLPDLYARAHRAFRAGDPTFARLPTGPDAQEDLEDIRWLLQEQAPEQLARYVSPDGQTLRLAGRATALDTAASQRLFAQIREAAERTGLPDVRLTGNFVVLSNMSTTLVPHQVEGLALALLLIGGTLVLQFRSLRLGLLGLIPTAVPILLIYGLMGWLGIALSVPTAMIACVALGMTVDGTIHLMARFRAVFDETGDYLATVKQMLLRSGRATVFASITLCLGFCAGAFSSFIPSIHFAVLTGATLLVGLACVVLLLPLLLCLLRPLGAPGKARNQLAPLALLLLLPMSATPAMPGEGVVLQDQYGKEDSVGQHRGKTVLLLYGQATGLRRMKVWEDKVGEKTTHELVILRGLDVRPVRGKKTEEEVNERLRKAVPPGISLLLDWNGDLARAYEIPAVKMAAVVISPEGTPCGVVTGSTNPESLDRVLGLIAHAAEEGTCP